MIYRSFCGILGMAGELSKHFFAEFEEAIGLIYEFNPRPFQAPFQEPFGQK